MIQFEKVRKKHDSDIGTKGNTLYDIHRKPLVGHCPWGHCAVSAAESVAVSSETVITSHHHLCQLCTKYTPVDTKLDSDVLAHFKIV